MKTKYADVIGSDRIVLGIISFIVFCLSLYQIISPSLVGMAIHFFIGLPFILLFYIIVLIDFFRLSKNGNIVKSAKAMIRYFLFGILVLLTVSITPIFVFEFVVG